MCPHLPTCPTADRPDRAAARTVAFRPGQGWSLLCNGVIVFDDLGEILPDGRVGPAASPGPFPATRRGVRNAAGARKGAGAGPDRAIGIRPSSRARVTASVRLAAPSLPRMWLTCFLTVSRVTTSSPAMAWFDRPAASIPSTSSSRLVSGSTRPGTAGGARPGTRRGVPRVKCALEPGQAAERDLCGGLPGPLGRDQPAQQRGHRRPLVGEDADIALRAGQRERLGQGGHRAGFLAAGRQRQRPQRADLDQAAGPVLGRGRRVQPVQQRERLTGPVLGQQHPGQHQVPGLAGVAWLVVRAEAVLLGRSAPRRPGRPGPAAAAPAAPGPGSAGPAGPGEACPASAIASSAPAGSPVACQIIASVARPSASGGV